MAGLWRNKKNGQLYEFLFYARDATNLPAYSGVIVYRAPDGTVWSRESHEFHEKFEPGPDVVVQG